jgi:hypothetical protein
MSVSIVEKLATARAAGCLETDGVAVPLVAVPLVAVPLVAVPLAAVSFELEPDSLLEQETQTTAVKTSNRVVKIFFIINKSLRSVATARIMVAWFLSAGRIHQ